MKKLFSWQTEGTDSQKCNCKLTGPEDCQDMCRASAAGKNESSGQS